jgi:hypothetical protein
VKEESNLDEDAVADHEEGCKARKIERAEKKFVRSSWRRASSGQAYQGDAVLRSRMGAAEDEFARLEKERGTGKATLERLSARRSLSRRSTGSKIRSTISIPGGWPGHIPYLCLF